MENNIWTYHRRSNGELAKTTQQRAVSHVEIGTSNKFYQGLKDTMVRTHNKEKRGRNSKRTVKESHKEKGLEEVLEVENRIAQKS